MVSSPFSSYKIEDRSYIAFIKREIHNLVSGIFDEKRTGEIDIVVSELTSNLIKYANGGELLYRISQEDDEPLFELICLDSGPGIENISLSKRDGVTSGSSLGQGIGSVFRLSTFVQFYSLPDWGTVVYARFRKNNDFVEPVEALAYRCLNVTYPGEKVSGDTAAVKVVNNQPAFLIADGLGHGVNANIAGMSAVDSFAASTSADPTTILREIHNDIRRTRGVVATVAHADFKRQTWEICGVGNISLRIYNGLNYKGYITNNGIVGMTIPTRLENMSIPMSKFQQLVLASDGLRTKWNISKYSGILKYDPMIFAAVLYKDESRGTDDTTILIIKVL